MVIVSHDRHMLKTVTDELMIVDNKKVMEFAGDLDDYAQWLKDKDKAEQAEIIGSETENKPVSRKEQRKLEAELRKKLQPLKRNVDKLEKQLDSLSTQQADLEKILADPNIYTEENKQKLKQTLLKKRETDSSLEDIEMQWMEASEDYEQQFTNLSLS